MVIGAKELYNSLKEQLTTAVRVSYSIREVDTMLRWLLEHTLGIIHTDILLNKELVITEQNQETLKQCVDRIKRNEPIQYILGKCEFYGREFVVNSHVLIPRPETEELIQYVLQQHKGDEGLRILDIGTGSGCIAITLAKELATASIWALDISQEALQVTRKNAEQLQASVNLIEMDILSDSPDIEGLDILVSNPPYVLASEVTTMRLNVQGYEPAQALFVEDDNPLLFYRRISELCISKLASTKWVYLEVHENYATNVADLFREIAFTEVRIVQDLQGKDRMVVAHR